MVTNSNDVGFIHDVGSLDSLRKKAVSGDKDSEKEALGAAARQFEAVFTSMLFKSMRDANSSFKSELFDSQTQDQYQQMLDSQMSSELSASGSLGLADMIVAQLSQGQSTTPATPSDESAISAMNVGDKIEAQQDEGQTRDVFTRLQDARAAAALNGQRERSISPLSSMKTTSRKGTMFSNRTFANTTSAIPNRKAATKFDSPESFVSTLAPYARKAAKSLGVEPSLLLAQAALETGWGKKVVKNSRSDTNNLFNIKADKHWGGDKVATQTLEFYDNIPVKENASFRSYNSYQDSFNDYVNFLNHNPRYEHVVKNETNTSENFIHGIHKAGYATDPDYADKVLRVKATIDQMQLDEI